MYIGWSFLSFWKTAQMNMLIRGKSHFLASQYFLGPDQKQIGVIGSFLIYVTGLWIRLFRFWVSY